MGASINTTFTEIIHKINWVDIVALVLLLRAIYMGLRRGLTAELFNFIGAILSLIFAVYWYSYAADILIVNFNFPIWFSQILCFIIITQFIRLIFKYGVIGLLKVMNVQFIPQMERLGGGLVGFGRGVLIVATLLLALSIIPNEYISESLYGKSFSGVFFIRVAERTYKSLTFWLSESDTEKDIFSIPATKTKVTKNK